MGEQISQMWWSHTTGTAAVRRNKSAMWAVTWMNLMLRERGQTQSLHRVGFFPETLREDSSRAREGRSATVWKGTPASSYGLG